MSTPVAAYFICRCRNNSTTPENIKAATDHIYYLAKQGTITRHGQPKRGQALWDLVELARPYSAGTTVIVPEG